MRMPLELGLGIEARTRFWQLATASPFVQSPRRKVCTWGEDRRGSAADHSGKAKRLEFRPPDPTANPYLAFSALLMAGLDGIQSRIDPGQPVDVDLFELSEAELREIKHVPASLDEALDALEEDHEFLLQGGVFTEDLIETWIEYKRKTEADAVRLRPHPWEFALYYDA
jgi:glutamine synthetase